MPKKVTKRSGSREPFDEEKIRNAIRAAAKEAGFPDDRVEQVVDEVAQSTLDAAAGRDEITTSEIREIILSELDSVEPAVAEAWRSYDKAQGKA
jgi:transcriptional regulator NrdR family protein